MESAVILGGVEGTSFSKIVGEPPRKTSCSLQLPVILLRTPPVALQLPFVSPGVAFRLWLGLGLILLLTQTLRLACKLVNADMPATDP